MRCLTVYKEISNRSKYEFDAFRHIFMRLFWWEHTEKAANNFAIIRDFAAP